MFGDPETRVAEGLAWPPNRGRYPSLRGSRRFGDADKVEYRESGHVPRITHGIAQSWHRSIARDASEKRRMAVAVAVREKPEPLQRQLTWWALAFPLIMLVP